MNQPHPVVPWIPYDDLLALPENLVGEVINGQLYTRPSPSGPYGVAEAGLAIELSSPFDKDAAVLAAGGF